jgi:hypothetical protein
MEVIKIVIRNLLQRDYFARHEAVERITLVCKRFMRFGGGWFYFSIRSNNGLYY